MRIVSLITSKESIDLVVNKSLELAQKLNAGVTLLFVEPEPLFEIPNFEETSDFEDNKKYIENLLKEKGLNWVFFAYQADPKSHLLLEISKEHPNFVISDKNHQIEEIVNEIESPIYVVSNQKSIQKASIFIERGVVLQEELPPLLKSVLPNDFDCTMLYEEMFVPDPVMLDTITISPATIEMDLELQEQKRKELQEFCSKLNKESSFEIFSLNFGLDMLEAELVIFWIRNRDSLVLSLAEDSVKSDKDIFVYLEGE